MKKLMPLARRLKPLVSLLALDFARRPRRSVNYLRACLAAARRPTYVRNAPVSLNIEPTTACNLKCTMCDRTYSSDLNLGSLSFDDFKEILSQFHYLLGSHHIQTGLLMTGLGEPFLNKNLLRMIKYAKNQGYPYVHTITNGTVLDATKTQGIIESGLDHISVSMDGATKETFESIRVGAQFEKVVSSIKDLAIKRTTRNKPFIDLNITIQDQNRNELEYVVDLAFEMGVDRVSARVLNAKFAHIEATSSFGLTDEAIASAMQYARAKNLQFRYADDDSDPCVYPWIWPYVTWNGYITPCCYNSDPRNFNFGNLLETSFEDIWNSSIYRDFRRDLVSDTPPEICRRCPKCPSSYTSARNISANNELKATR
ncbi:MAG: radical SAM protein [Deltaproteobacteria bacterium]|nr:radical SAM protein [Deltaproteobacteria bacterium]